MIATIQHQDTNYQVNLDKGIDLSIPMRADAESVRAWYVDPISIDPVKGDGFVGAVNQGGSVNFNNIFFNPHGHGTHTECLGHITEEFYSINELITEFWHLALVCTVQPELNEKGEAIIKTKHIKDQLLANPNCNAIIFKTLPNPESKKGKNYSSTNPPFISESCAKFICDHGIDHLLIDLPSVDPEVDGGKLLAHRAFWNFSGERRKHASITELIYVPNNVNDGIYFLHLSFAAFHNDASPSKPIIYPTQKI
mgnify:CR=1 FL=1